MTNAAVPYHIPVMLAEVLAVLRPADGAVYIDATFGAGGYTRAILESAACTVIAIDRDQTALAAGAALKARYGDRLILCHGPFSAAATLAAEAGYDRVDGIVADLGVSSMQLDGAARGFSFRFDGPLDMRMDQHGGGESAADVVNSYPEEEIADILYRYGDERKSRRIARAIVAARKQARIETTTALAEIIRSVLPRTPKDQSDPATRSFQALRIHVNAEMAEIETLLDESAELLNPGGRLVVVAFHSLEDGIVKRFLQEASGRRSAPSRHLPDAGRRAPTLFTLPFRKAVFPSDAEVAGNPRSRSARLRAGIRTDQKGRVVA
ncbi:MAG: 16S rRNA (cytosine(1402)-N(4))-methyltransferase RsmH [Alphaproteobacteria bacterium]|nr:16S rRNA (cytosine(1402)-N(4))-methyltransferase RsmH [Alphaproteobacteria bacterium]